MDRHRALFVLSVYEISAAQLIESNKSLEASEPHQNPMGSSSSEAGRRESSSSRRPQFNLRMAFLLTLVVAVTAATWGGLTREGPDRLFFLFFAAVAPFAVLVVVGIVHEILRRRPKR